jgi:hypothetical protein
MRTNLLRVTGIAAFLALFAMPSTASATILTSAPGTIGSESGSYTPIQTTGPVAWSIGTADAGTVTETVVSGFSGSGIGPFTGLSFIYSLTVTKGIIQTLSTSDYTGFLVDAGVLASPSGFTTSGSINSGVVNLVYSPVLANNTITVILNTNALDYTFGQVSLIDGGVWPPLPNTTTFFAPLVGGPSITTPEPASLTLCAIGLVTFGGFGAWRRRRNGR